MAWWSWLLIVLGAALVFGLLIFFFVQWQNTTVRAEKAENALALYQGIVERRA
jgi:hypothetical protein